MTTTVGKRTLLGVFTPSSNTVLEPVTSSILTPLADVSAHFGRFRVKEISLEAQALEQFDTSPVLAAADLLADAKVGSIIWSGTSAGWLGFATDEALCRQISDATGIPAGSSVLALNDTFARTAVRRFALVTPYRQDVQEKIIGNYSNDGYECVAERHTGDQDNFSFSRHSEEAIVDMIREVMLLRLSEQATICCVQAPQTQASVREPRRWTFSPSPRAA